MTWRVLPDATSSAQMLLRCVGAAIGDEVDRVAVPHRLRVVGRIVRQVPRRERLEVEEPQVRRPAAAIALPGAEVLRHRHVDEVGAVCGDGAELAIGHWQLFGQATVEADEIELTEALAAALAARGKQHALAVRVPADHAVCHRMMRQAYRFAAVGADHVDVGVAVVSGAVGDLRAVWRKARERLLALR